MMKQFFSPHGLWQEGGLAVIRIWVGLFMLYHGYEVFDGDKMEGYTQKLAALHFPVPALMAYLGKGSEFMSGMLLAMGLFTRMAAIMLAITMLIITFWVGEGRIYMEEQYPFLFVLLAMVFFFTGSGKWSLDYFIFRK